MWRRSSFTWFVLPWTRLSDKFEICFTVLIMGPWNEASNASIFDADSLDPICNAPTPLPKLLIAVIMDDCRAKVSCNRSALTTLVSSTTCPSLIATLSRCFWIRLSGVCVILLGSRWVNPKSKCLRHLEKIVIWEHKLRLFNSLVGSRQTKTAEGKASQWRHNRQRSCRPLLSLQLSFRISEHHWRRSVWARWAISDFNPKSRIIPAKRIVWQPREGQHVKDRIAQLCRQPPWICSPTSPFFHRHRRVQRTLHFFSCTLTVARYMLVSFSRSPRVYQPRWHICPNAENQHFACPCASETRWPLSQGLTMMAVATSGV